MRKRTGLAAGTSLLAASFTILGASVGAGVASASTGSRVVGHDYVNGNTAVSNTVDVFDRHADGSVTIDDTPAVDVGGTGTAAGLGSQGAIQATSDGRFLLAVDAGSNQISVLKVNGKGLPSLAAQPYFSGGVKPVSIAISPDDSLVYVANVGKGTTPGGSNYTGFRLSDKGKLTPLAGSTVAVPEGSGVGDVVFNSRGDRLVGTRDNPSLIDSFIVRDNGRLVAAEGSPFTGQGLGQIGAEFRPTDPSQLFVSNAHNGAGLGTVSAFNDSRQGVLTSIGASPVPDGQTAPCWIEVSKDGRFLFTTNTASGNISSYSIQKDGSLVLFGTFAFTNGTGAVDIRLAPDGRTLSVTGGRGHVLSTFRVDGGSLTELAGSPVALPADGSPTGLVSL